MRGRAEGHLHSEDGIWRWYYKVLPHRIAILAGVSALALAVLGTVAVVIAWSGGDSDTGPAANSGLNTASQSAFENSATLAGIEDAPVAFPNERVIYPPRTGNAGMAGSRDAAVSALALLGVMVAVITGARIMTRTSGPSHRGR